MKTIKYFFYLVAFLVIELKANAQTTYVPDDNFEQALIDMGYDDVLDDYVLTEDINTITVLDVSSKNINDLTGIEDFTALETLHCYSNNLTVLDLSDNIILVTLDCRFNNLSSLNISNNTALEWLACSANNLTNLDVSGNPNLTNLFCDQNNLSSLDVTNNTALVYMGCGQNNLTSLDVSNKTALETLSCGGNNLTNLNVSNCPILNSIYCEENDLTNLNISTVPNLFYLNCSQNNLESIDVSSNLSLYYFFCYQNNITSLDVSGNIFLALLDCKDNLLTQLNVKNGNNQAINYNFYATNNPNLTCIQVDDAAWSTANWTNIDPQQYFSEDCSLGIDDYNAENLSVFPNPTQDFFQIETNMTIQEVIIYNSLGKTIVKCHSKERYDVSNLNKGIYFLSIRLNNKKVIHKLLID